MLKPVSPCIHSLFHGNSFSVVQLIIISPLIFVNNLDSPSWNFPEVLSIASSPPLKKVVCKYIRTLVLNFEDLTRLFVQVSEVKSVDPLDYHMVTAST